MLNRQFNPGVAAIAIAVMCVLMMIVAAGAIAMREARQSAHVIRVPGDYPGIQQAVDAAVPGDVIQVGPGTFSGTVVLNKSVTLVAEKYDAIDPSRNTVILDGLGGAAVIVIPPDMTQMPVIRGFVIRNALNGIEAHSPFIVESSFFNTATLHVDYLEGSGGINRGNLFFQSLDDSIHMDNANRPLLIENNRILYSGDNGIEIGLQASPSTPNTAEVDIWNNMIIGNQEDGIQLIDFTADPADLIHRLVVVGNLIANNKHAGLGLLSGTAPGEDYSGADISAAVRVYNDTFYGNDVAISGGDNLVAFNNIITNSTAKGVWKVQGPAGGNSVVAYTLFFNNAMDTDQTVLGPGLLTGLDPLFAAPPNPGPDGAWGTLDDDFSGLLLSSGSPAIDKGVAQYVAASGEPIPPSPITGFAGAAPDLGWREFGSPVILTPSPTLIATFTLQATNTPFVVSPVPTLTFTVAPPTVPANTATPVTSASPTITSPAPTSPPAATLTSSPTAAPVLAIASILPNSAQANSTISITVTGSGFVNGSVAVFEGGQGTPSEVTAVQVLNPQTLVMTVNVKADPAFGSQLWDLRITNPDLSTAVLLDAFTVNPAP